MPKKNEYTGMGLLIYTAVQNLGVTRQNAAVKLNISSSTLFGYFTKPPTDIEVLIELSQKLDCNLLEFYTNREPLKGMLATKDASIQKLEDEIQQLKKDKDNLYYTIELQKKLLDGNGKQEQE